MQRNPTPDAAEMAAIVAVVLRAKKAEPEVTAARQHNEARYPDLMARLDRLAIRQLLQKDQDDV